MPYESEKGMDEKQEAILKYIREYYETLGRSPSVTEIVMETKILPISLVTDYLNQLEHAGYIEQNRFGIKLKNPILSAARISTADRKLRVFLCHSSQDKPIVRELYQRLLAEGWIDPWLDDENILPGQDWNLEIEQAVEAADAVIVCVSSVSVSKEGYVQKELRRVLQIAEEKLEGAIFVLPVRLDDCQMPRQLKDKQFLDYFPDTKRDSAFEKLKMSLKLRKDGLGGMVKYG